MERSMMDLKQLQALPLSLKIRMTQERLRQWINEYGEDGVYISFSGGKDSTVLLDIARKMYPGLKAMFVDVPTQYPELKEFATSFENVDVVKPKKNFFQVCEEYGFPLISKEVAHKFSDLYSARKNGNYDSCSERQLNGTYVSKNGKKNMLDVQKWKFIIDSDFRISHKCCNVMKKDPSHEYEKKTGRHPITAQMASESLLRANTWIKHGCNMFDTKTPKSNPMSFWTEQDVLNYIHANNLPICSVYGDVVIDYDYENNVDGQMDISQLSSDFGSFETMSRPLKTTGCSRTGCVICGFGCHLENKEDARFLKLKETHPQFYRFLFIAKNNGITYAEAIDWLNEHGNLNIPY